MINASLQRGCLAKGFYAAGGCCKKADEPATQAERDPDFKGAGHSWGDSLEPKKVLAVAGRAGAGVREGSRRLERCRQIHSGA